MKRFLRNTALFFFPLVGLLIFIWSRPVSKEQQWSRVRGNCSKAACVYNLCTDRRENIDVAFLGTSRTMNAINDSALSKAWNMRVANLGYCRPGRNVQLEILKLLLANHSLKAIFIEVNQEEDWYGHFDFGNVVSTEEALFSYRSKNPKYLRDLKRNFVMKYDLFQNRLLDTSYAGENCFWGFSNILVQGNNLNPVSFADTNSADQRFTSLFYLEQIIGLAKQHNCTIYFHYLSTLGLTDYRPHLESYYVQSGRLIYPPNQLSDESLWADNSHIILKGANIYTQHLIQEIPAQSFK